MEAKLLIVAGDADRTEVELKLPTVIGRSRDADVTIAHPLVSRRHCEISEEDDGRLKVRDLGSLNGTFVGQTRIEESVLAPGDLLTVGAITFRAVYGDYDENDGDSIDFTLDDGAPSEPAAKVDTQIGDDTERASGAKKAGDEIPLADVPDGQTQPVAPKKAAANTHAAADDDADDDFDLDWLMDDD